MHTFLNVYQIYVVGTVVILIWFSLDMRSIIKASQRKNALSIEGRWKELDEHYKRCLNRRRPFVWLHQRFLVPGNLLVQYALFLYKHGRLDEALDSADRAAGLIRRKPWIFRSFHRSATSKTLAGAINARILILTGMGRYGEARAAAVQFEQVAGSGQRPYTVLALLEYHCGRLDEALALTEAVAPGDTMYDSACGVSSLAWSMKGEFARALRALAYEPSDISKFYSPKGLEIMRASPEGVKLMELQQKKHAGVFQPARLLFLAHVHIAREDFVNADHALDQAEKVVGPEPGVQMSYCRHRACSAAAQGRAAEAGQYIERMRSIVQERQKRGLQWEAHLGAGRSYLYLGRLSEALVELTAAETFVLHPLEKHVTAYWIAQVHAAAGDRQKALPYYQSVAADAIPSWMRKRAIEALA